MHRLGDTSCLPPSHAEQWLTSFDAQGGVAGYQQRMRAYYDTYAYTDESYRV